MNDNVVISYIASRWIVWIILLIIASVIFIIFSFISSIKKIRSYIVALFVLVAIFITVPTIQAVIDITQKSYITEKVEYYRSDPSNTRNNIIASESVQVTGANGKTLILIGAGKDFPYGKFTGNVTYAKRSKIIISFVKE